MRFTYQNDAATSTAKNHVKVDVLPKSTSRGYSDENSTSRGPKEPDSPFPHGNKGRPSEMCEITMAILTFSLPPSQPSQPSRSSPASPASPAQPRQPSQPRRAQTDDIHTAKVQFHDFGRTKSRVFIAIATRSQLLQKVVLDT